MDMDEPTSIKGFFQNMVPGDTAVVEGVVLKADPLEVTLVNDTKIILSSNSLILPTRLTDHEIIVDIDNSSATVNIQSSGDETITFNSASKVKMTIHNALKANDHVYLLQYNKKQYYVLDRKE